MKITTVINFEGSANLWEFKVNDEAFIETTINSQYSDTLYDMGKVNGFEHLETIVKYLLRCWKVEHSELQLYKTC